MRDHMDDSSLIMRHFLSTRSTSCSCVAVVDRLQSLRNSVEFACDFDAGIADCADRCTGEGHAEAKQPQAYHALREGVADGRQRRVLLGPRARGFPATTPPPEGERRTEDEGSEAARGGRGRDGRRSAGWQQRQLGARAVEGRDPAPSRAYSTGVLSARPGFPDNAASWRPPPLCG